MAEYLLRVERPRAGEPYEATCQALTRFSTGERLSAEGSKFAGHGSTALAAEIAALAQAHLGQPIARPNGREKGADALDDGQGEPAPVVTGAD